MKKYLLIAVLTLSVMAQESQAGRIYGKTTFYGDVALGSWTSLVSGITMTPASGGAYTNEQVYTNWYRLAGSNLAGRIPGTTNMSLSFTGGTNGTNAVALTWSIYDGLSSYIVERSNDEGASWTNWLSLSAGLTNWTDTGTNSWTNSIFTNLYALIPGPTTVFASSAEGAAGTNAQARVAILETNTASLAQGIIATNAQARVAVLETNTASLAQGIAGTNAQARVAVLETNTASLAQGIIATNAQARVSILETNTATKAQGLLAVTALQSLTPLMVVTNITTNSYSVTTNVLMSGLTSSYLGFNGLYEKIGDTTYRLESGKDIVWSGQWILSISAPTPDDLSGGLNINDPTDGTYTGSDQTGIATWSNTTNADYTTNIFVVGNGSGLSNLTYAAYVATNGMGSFTASVISAYTSTSETAVVNGDTFLKGTTFFNDTASLWATPMKVKGTAGGAPRVAIFENVTNDAVIALGVDDTDAIVDSTYGVSAGYKGLSFKTSGAKQMSILASGSVGIGTNVPAAKLHVAGEVLASNVTVTGTGVIASANINFNGTTRTNWPAWYMRTATSTYDATIGSGLTADGAWHSLAIPADVFTNGVIAYRLLINVNDTAADAGGVIIVQSSSLADGSKSGYGINFNRKANVADLASVDVLASGSETNLRVFVSSGTDTGEILFQGAYK